MDQTLASTANHALEACERMLRPIMRLALDRGLKYQDIDELIRDLMLDEAARDWAKRNGKEPSGSQLSVTTGINRKEVKKRILMQVATERLPASGSSLAEQVFWSWHFQKHRNPTMSVLPLDDASTEKLSFAKLVRDLGGDVHFRSVLDELVRLKLVSEESSKVKLQANSYIPGGLGKENLALLADNTSSHINAAVSNVAANEEEPYLERAIWGEEISLDDCKKIQGVAREAWQTMRARLYEEIANTPAASDAPKFRIRVGTYAYFEAIHIEES
jgi:hypothetical protein